MGTAEDFLSSGEEYVGRTNLARRIEMQEQSRTLVPKRSSLPDMLG